MYGRFYLNASVVVRRYNSDLSLNFPLLLLLVLDNDLRLHFTASRGHLLDESRWLLLSPSDDQIVGDTAALILLIVLAG